MLEVLRLCGKILREQEWEVMCALFIYRDPEEAEKEEPAAKETVVPAKEIPVRYEDVSEPENWAKEVAPVAVDGWNEEEARLG